MNIKHSCRHWAIIALNYSNDYHKKDNFSLDFIVAILLNAIYQRKNNAIYNLCQLCVNLKSSS